MFANTLSCQHCGKSFAGNSGCYSCPDCAGMLHVVFDFTGREAEARSILTTMPGARRMWHYAEFLPIEDPAQAVTLGEGDTPLVRAPNLERELGIAEIWLKNESLNPSGTFKDRCMSVAYSKTRELGGKGMILGSGGNAAAASSAYAARSGMPCYVLIPEVTPRERVVHNILYGARVILVRGTINDCIDLGMEIQQRLSLHNATTASTHNPYQAEGPKTIAYEISRQLDWKTPDWVLTPIGGGGILTSIHNGFGDLNQLGLSPSRPRMCGCQALGCSAVYNAFRDGKAPDQIERVPNPKTIAVAIADPLPLDGKTALAAIYDSDGAATGLEEDEILAAQALLARSEGIIADPASSCTIGGLIRLRRDGRVKPSEKVVLVVTGTGLKDLRLAGEKLTEPPRINPTLDELSRAFTSHFAETGLS